MTLLTCKSAAVFYLANREDAPYLTLTTRVSVTSRSLWATKVPLWAPTRHQPEVMFPLSSVMLFKTEFKTRLIKANFRIFISSLKWVICRKCKLWRLSSRFSCCGLLLASPVHIELLKKKNTKKRISTEILASFQKPVLKCIQLARKN